MARICLEQLGFIDGRNGKARDGVTSLSEFINKCIVDAVMLDTHGRRIKPTTESCEAVLLRVLLNREQQEILKHSDMLQLYAKKLKDLQSKEDGVKNNG